MPERSNVHLNIMYDPWLKIEWINNKKEEINLYKAITEAHNIRRIVPVGENKLTTYIINAFVIDFVQWVYKPIAYDSESAREAILSLFESGKFDENILDEYIRYYENTLGKSFDLFDEEYPFLQISKKEKNTIFKKIPTLTPLSSPKFGLNYTAGNNVVFEHKRNSVNYKKYQEIIECNNGKIPPLEDCYTFSPEETFIGLLYCLGYNQSSGGGLSSVSTSGIQGLHPIFVLIEGESLFQTICASIGTAREYSFQPIWEKDSYFTNASNIILEANDDLNAVPLTYLPTVYVSLNSLNNCFEKNISKKDIGEEEAPKSVYQLWMRSYPRIISTNVTDKYGNQYEKAMVYQFQELTKSSVELGTQLLQIGCTADRCKVISDNYRILNEKYPSLNLNIYYYACTHTNASCSSIKEMSEILEWPKNRKFIEKEDSKIQLSIILKTICELAQTSAYYLTVSQGLATGNVKKDEKGKYVVGGKQVSKYARCSSSSVMKTIDECIWIIENEYYEKLLDLDNNEEICSVILNRVFTIFENMFIKNIDITYRLSMIDKVEIKNKWEAQVSKIMEVR